MSNQSIDFARFLNIRSAIAPVVAPDGAQIAFLTDITGNYQVWSVATSGEPAWPRQLTFFADKVWELYGTPAAEHLVAVGDVGGNERQQFYLIDGYGMRTDDAGKHPIEEHDVRRLTRDDEAIHRFGAFSRDGMRIALTSNARNGVDFDLYLLDITTGAQTLVAEMAGNQTVLAFAPDERAVLTLDAVAGAETELYRVDITTGARHHVTAGQPPARYQSVTWRDAASTRCRTAPTIASRSVASTPDDGALDVILAADTLLADAAGDAGTALENGELELLASGPRRAAGRRDAERGRLQPPLRAGPDRAGSSAAGRHPRRCDRQPSLHTRRRRVGLRSPGAAAQPGRLVGGRGRRRGAPGHLQQPRGHRRGHVRGAHADPFPHL
ncbi:MAG: hypothetical protein H6644_16415 [Caldilineaceae bacterium]|nr:hypothetical protein [Caldilineaceae bacterium]